MNTPLDNNSLDKVPAYASMNRSTLGDYLAGIGLSAGRPTDIIVQVLGQDPRQMNTRTLQIAQIALSLLPIGELAPTLKKIYARQIHPTLNTFVSNVAGAMDMAAGQGVSFDVTPERLVELVKQQAAYGSFKLLGMQMTDSGMDQRAVVGSFLAFLIDRTLAALQRRLADPKLSQTERDRLIDDFAAALLRLDEVLKYPVTRKEDVAAAKMDKAEQLKQAQADAQLEATKLKLRQHIVAPRQELFAAATRQKQLQDKHAPKGHHAAGTTATGAAAGDAAGLPPPTPPRRIV